MRRRELVAKLRPDLTALRESRDLRRVVLGNVVSNLGTQATLVALPYQLYVETHSPLLVGLLGAVEFVPLISASLIGGAIADRMDRRKLCCSTRSGWSRLRARSRPQHSSGIRPSCSSTLLAAVLAVFAALQNVSRSAIIPNLVDPSRLRSALAFNYGLTQVTMVVGPRADRRFRRALGLYGRCAQLLRDGLRRLGDRPTTPGGRSGPSTRPSFHRRGPRIRAQKPGSARILCDRPRRDDLGMPRALFAVLSVSVYHAGATGTGILYASVSVGDPKRRSRPGG